MIREISYPQTLGDYVQQLSENGRCIILRGKFKGCYLDTIPKGYVRSFILPNWELTAAETRLFETHAQRTDAEEAEHLKKEAAKLEKQRLREEKALAKLEAKKNRLPRRGGGRTTSTPA